MLRKECFTLCLLLAALAVAVAGCSKAENDDGAPTTPVVFDTALSPADTRAQNADITASNIRSMAVFAYYSGQSDFNYFTAGWPNFMSNEQVTRTSSTAPWKYSPVKYWPNTKGDKISFFAYAPYNAEGVSTESIGPYIEFTVPEYEADHSDLTIATPLMNAKKGTSLLFKMKHVLTKVEFRIKSTNEATISYFVLTEVYRRGLLDCTQTPFVWEIYKTEDDMEDGQSVLMDIYTDISSSVPLKVPANTLTTIGCFYMLPEFPESASFYFSYSLGGNSETRLESFLYDSPSKGWTMGGHIIYTILIEGGANVSITSTSVGSDWPSTPEDAGDDDLSVQ